jgi:hypothetical protein
MLLWKVKKTRKEVAEGEGKENKREWVCEGISNIKGISSGVTHFSIRVRLFESDEMVEIDRASICVGSGSCGTTHNFFPFDKAIIYINKKT